MKLASFRHQILVVAKKKMSKWREGKKGTSVSFPILTTRYSICIDTALYLVSAESPRRKKTKIVGSGYESYIKFNRII